MKIRILVDVYPWMQSKDLYFLNAEGTNVGAKATDTTRYIIETELPDPTHPDYVLQGTAKEAPNEAD